MIEKKNTLELYNLPKDVKFCTRCTISNQRPRITFDEAGVCSACNFAEYKRKIDWEKRNEELLHLLDKHRRSDGSHDVIVPCSGGKDGSFVAHQLKHEYGMNPLTVTWSPNIFTDIGFKNYRNFIDSGFDNILGTPSGEVNRRLCALSFEKLGDPFQAFIYGQSNFPMKIAVDHGIQLIFYGENGEVEYGGNMNRANIPTREIKNNDWMYFSGYPLSYWEDLGFTKSDLHAYCPPSYDSLMANKTEIHFLGYYEFWDPQENYYYACEHTKFTPADERSEGTYSRYASLDDKLDGLHYYLAYLKFGLGRATSDTAHEIRDGKISREDGISLIRRYDSEFPERYYQDFLEYLNISAEKSQLILDSWTSEHLFEKRGNGYALKKSIWDQ